MDERVVLNRVAMAVAAVMAACVITFGLCVGQAHAAGLAAEGLAAESGTSSVNVEVKYGQTEARSMLAMINSFRTGADAWAWNSSNTEKVAYSDLGKLTYDYKLERVAMLRAAEIALSYSHTRPDGVTKAWDTFDGWWTVGENIAAGYSTASQVFEGWQEKNEQYSGQGHRRNMLNSSFTAVGIGHVVCNGCHYWVQEFCAPTLDSTEVAADDSKRTVSIDVADSVLTKRTASASQASISMQLGKSVALPAVNAGVGTDDTWPSSTVPVSGASVVWTSGNASVAKISGAKVQGLKAGSTTLTAKVTFAGSTVNVSVPVTVAKAANPMKVSGLTAKVNYSKKKARTVKASQAYKFSKKAVGKLTYSRVAKGSSKWLTKVNSKNGAITVKKGAPKGKTQKIKVKITAKGNSSYQSVSKTVTVKVKVK